MKIVQLPNILFLFLFLTVIGFCLYNSHLGFGAILLERKVEVDHKFKAEKDGEDREFCDFFALFSVSSR